MSDPLYYEAHVTTEPVFDERFDVFTSTATRYGFKPAKLLLQKRASDTPERSSKDSFCTGRGKDYNELRKRAEDLVYALNTAGIKVWRYKIESVLLDIRGDNVRAHDGSSPQEPNT
jgi:hypothetical protein